MSHMERHSVCTAIIPVIIIIAIKRGKEENGGYKIGEDLC